MSLTATQQLELVHQARQGSACERQSALEQLLQDFRAPAMAVIGRTLRAGGVGMEHAEEAWLQAAFKFYATGLARFEQRAAPRTYFVRTALNAAIDLVRWHCRQQPFDETDLAETVGTGDSAAVALERRDHLRAIVALQRCLEGLPARYREAIELYYLEEVGTCQRCGERLGISRAALMKRLERARQRLAECVQARLSSAAPAAEKERHG